jgi:hypothetical protein
MNIIEQTSTKLKLEEHNQQWLWGVLLGIPHITIGFWIAVAGGNVTTLECLRTQPTQMTCERTIVGLLGTETTMIPGQVIGASVTTSSGIGVKLNTSKGQVELVNHRMFVSEKHRQIADNINAFVNNPDRQPRLKIQQDDRWEELIFGAWFFLPGFVLILYSLAIPIKVLCNFDKISGQMTLEKEYRLFGIKFTTQQKLTEIQHAKVTQLPIPNRNPLHVVNLELTSAKAIAVSPPTRDQKQCQTIVEAINKFLRQKGVI